MKSKNIVENVARYTMLIGALCLGSCLDSGHREDAAVGDVKVSKQEMQVDGIVRLAKIEVYPEHRDEYIQYAMEVGDISLRTEPGVLTMYALVESEDPCVITVLETYSSQEAYQSHIASSHFQKYKQETIHMIKSLELTDQKPLNPSNKLINFIKD